MWSFLRIDYAYLVDSIIRAARLHTSRERIDYGNTGQYQKALDCYPETSTLYEAFGDRGGEVRILNNTARTLGLPGDDQKSLAMYLQIEENHRTIGQVDSDSSTTS